MASTYLIWSTDGTAVSQNPRLQRDFQYVLKPSRHWNRSPADVKVIYLSEHGIWLTIWCIDDIRFMWCQAEYPRVPIIWSARSSGTEWVCKKQRSKVQCLGKITRRSRGFSCVTGSAVARCHFDNQAKDLLCKFTNQVQRRSRMTMPNVDKEAIENRWIQAIDRLNIGCRVLEENLIHQPPVSSTWSLASDQLTYCLICVNPRTSGLDCSPAMFLPVILVRALVWC